MNSGNTDNGFNFYATTTVDLETYEKLLNPVREVALTEQMYQEIMNPQPSVNRRERDRENLARLHGSRQKRERHRNLRKGR